MHRDLGRYNTGNRRGESVDEGVASFLMSQWRKMTSPPPLSPEQEARIEDVIRRTRNAKAVRLSDAANPMFSYVLHHKPEGMFKERGDAVQSTWFYGKDEIGRDGYPSMASAIRSYYSQFKKPRVLNIEEGSLAGNLGEAKVRIGYGTFNVFQRYWTGQSDPLYAVLSRRGPSVDWVVVDARPEEVARLREVAREILNDPSSDGGALRTAQSTLDRLKHIPESVLEEGSYTDDALLNYMKTSSGVISVAELKYAFGGQSAKHAARLKRLVKQGKLKAVPGTRGKSATYTLVEARVKGHPIHTTEHSLVTSSTEQVGWAGFVTYYFLHVKSDRGRSRGGWYQVKTYKDERKALEGAKHIDQQMAVWELAGKLWRHMDGDSPDLVSDLYEISLRGFMRRNNPDGKFKKADVMRMYRLFHRANGRAKRPFIKPEDLPSESSGTSARILEMWEAFRESPDDLGTLQAIEETFAGDSGYEASGGLQEPERTVDDVFDSILRKLIVMESPDVLEDVQFDDSGSVYLMLDPSLSRREVDEVVREIQSEHNGLRLVGSPNQSLPEETCCADWWVAFLPGQQNEGVEPEPQPDRYAHTPGKPGDDELPKEQMVVKSPPTSPDRMAMSVNVKKLFKGMGESRAARWLEAQSE